MIQLPVSKFLLLTPRFPEASGGATYIANTRAALESVGVDVTVVSLFRTGRESADPGVVTLIADEDRYRRPALRDEGGRVRPLLIRRYIAKRADVLRARRRARRVMRAHAEDACIVFAHPAVKSFIDSAGALKNLSRSVVVGQLHMDIGWLADDEALRDLLVREFHDVDVVTAPTQQSADGFGELVGVPSRRARNPYGRRVGESSSREAKDPTSRTAVALVRFTGEKQVPLMIAAFAHAVRSLSDERWRLNIYGAGPDEGEIRRAIVRESMQDRVRLCGVTSEPGRVLRESDLHLLTSSSEAFGFSILEASREGVATVAFDCSPGVNEQLRDGAGYLVEERTENAFAEALMAAMEDDAGRERVSAAARHRSACYAPELALAEWRGLLEEVFSARGYPPSSP